MFGGAGSLDGSWSVTWAVVRLPQDVIKAGTLRGDVRLPDSK
jgi:hypothetical protein